MLGKRFYDSDLARNPTDRDYMVASPGDYTVQQVSDFVREIARLGQILLDRYPTVDVENLEVLLTLQQ
jgi:hypothetical protein